MERKIYHLYLIRDLLNEKVYVGQTVNPSRRWNDHRWQAKRKQVQYIHRAMAKYGIENFTYEVIAQSLTQEDADETEIQLIKQYDSMNKNKGYNIAKGGNHSWNLGLPKELNPLTGIPRSEKTKQKMSNSINLNLIQRIAQLNIARQNPNRGALISAAKKGKKLNKTWKLIDGKRVWFEKVG